jgi:hypothetical protein
LNLLSTNGKIHKIDLRPSKWPRRSKEACKSELQWSVSCLLTDNWPNELVLEEFYTPGDGLYVDFFLPRRMVAIEVHGAQHFTYNAHFHGSRQKFVEAQQRDNRKKEWCQVNKIDLVEIPFNEKTDSILAKLKAVFGTV